MEIGLITGKCSQSSSHEFSVTAWRRFS